MMHLLLGEHLCLSYLHLHLDYLLDVVAAFLLQLLLHLLLSEVQPSYLLLQLPDFLVQQVNLCLLLGELEVLGVVHVSFSWLMQNSQRWDSNKRCFILSLNLELFFKSSFTIQKYILLTMKGRDLLG
jgi:hypothetical protein